jgi:hypothetical protein
MVRLFKTGGTRRVIPMVNMKSARMTSRTISQRRYTGGWSITGAMERMVKERIAIGGNGLTMAMVKPMVKAWKVKELKAKALMESVAT